MPGEQAKNLNDTSRLSWHVWELVLKSAMDKDLGVQAPACVPEPTDGREFVPLAGLSVVYVDWDGFPDLVCAPAEDCKGGPYEDA
jgi:hypothetical protein